MASFVTKQTLKQRMKYALVRTANTPKVGPKPQILQVLETYKNKQLREAKHDLRVYMRNGYYRLVRLTNNQKLTRVPTMF
jgi:hypothetical protein